MSKGTVKFFNETKGFGFIVEDGSENEIFVHITGVNETIRKDDKVSFDIQDGKKGKNAVNVKLL
jgi:CspA family cold shock protein